MKKALVIDDSPTERAVIEGILKAAGFEVTPASSGEEGVALAKSVKPDIILMDVVMPGTNGYQATREITRNSELKDIPVIICTSRGADSDKNWGMRQGANEYLVKPITKDTLLPAIEKALAGK